MNREQKDAIITVMTIIVLITLNPTAKTKDYPNYTNPHITPLQMSLDQRLARWRPCHGVDKYRRSPPV